MGTEGEGRGLVCLEWCSRDAGGEEWQVSGMGGQRVQLFGGQGPQGCTGGRGILLFGGQLGYMGGRRGRVLLECEMPVLA